MDDTRAFLESLEPRELAEYLIGGLATNDLPDDFRSGYVSLARESTRCARVPDAAAAEHAVHPRHHLLAVRRPDHEPALLAGPAWTRR